MSDSKVSISQDLIDAITLAVEQRDGQPQRDGEIRFRCPHPDRHSNGDAHPSADWNPDKGVWQCRVCGEGGGAYQLAELLGIEVKPRARSKGSANRNERGGGASSPDPARNGATVPEPGCTLEQYAVMKRLPYTFLVGMGLTEVHISAFGGKVVSIPYFDAESRSIATRYRTARHKPADGQPDNRFRWKSGSKALPYGLWRLSEARAAGYLVLVEGESDCHTLWYHGEHALGLPGVDTWNEGRDAAHLDGIERIYVVIEPDAGGDRLMELVAKSAIRDRVMVVDLGEHKDPSDLFCADPATFAERWEAARAAARSWSEVETERATRTRREAWAKCESLATAPRILDAFAEDLTRLGVVGEDQVAKLVYLCLVSRLLDRIVSLAVKGPSSGGKSFITQAVLRFFPESAYHVLTAMTERTLVYGEEPLAHRIVVIYEAAALTSDFGSYLLRSFLSEGRLCYETVEKGPNGQMRTRRLEREGPIGLLITTTAVNIHPENETRMFSVVVTDTPAQTAKILAVTAAGARPDVDLDPWHALQTWLETGSAEVVIPFADALAKGTKPSAVRIRRDFAAGLQLTRAHALLHQASRETDDAGRVIATIEDYAAVYNLVADIIQETVGEAVKPEVRETVEAVRELTAPPQDGDGELLLPVQVTITRLARHLGLDKSATSRRVAQAKHDDYIRNLEDRKGMPANLVIGEPMPEARSVLPPPEVLHRCTEIGNGTDPPPPPATWECRCGKHSTGLQCWGCGASRPEAGNEP